jgi:hypothetical protein
MSIRNTHTYVILEIDPEAFNDIKKKLRDAGYDHAFMPGGEIDMHGIAIAPDPARSALALGAELRRMEKDSG